MAHIHERIDFTASVLIVRDGAVLLHMHKKLGRWLQPGGHIELQEDPNEAALREAQEETGLLVELVNPLPKAAVRGGLILPRFLNRHHFNETHEHIDLVYLARPVSGEVRAEEEDAEPPRWFTREELERIDLGILEDVRAYALAAIDELS